MSVTETITMDLRHQPAACSTTSFQDLPNELEGSEVLHSDAHCHFALECGWPMFRGWDIDLHQVIACHEKIGTFPHPIPSNHLS